MKRIPNVKIRLRKDRQSSQRSPSAMRFVISPAPGRKPKDANPGDPSRTNRHSVRGVPIILGLSLKELDCAMHAPTACFNHATREARLTPCIAPTFAAMSDHALRDHAASSYCGRRSFARKMKYRSQQGEQMDNDSLLLWIELGFLVVALGVGIWRFHWLRRASGPSRPRQQSAAYDMRRDGQRLSVDG